MGDDKRQITSKTNHRNRVWSSKACVTILFQLHRILCNNWCIYSDKDVTFVRFVTELNLRQHELLLRLFILIVAPFVSFSLILDLLLLLVVCDLLKSEEIFTGLLVKLTINPGDDIQDSGDLNELQGIHSSICHLESLIQRHELRLEWSNCYQHFQESGESFTGALDSLTTTTETKQSRSFLELVFSSKRKDRQLHTSHVFSVHVETNISTLLHVVNYVSWNVTSSEISGGKAERGFFKVLTHAYFGLDNLLQNSAESFLQSVRLLLQQFEAFFSANSLLLIKLQVPAQRAIRKKIIYILEGSTCDILEFNYNLDLSKVTEYISRKPSVHFPPTLLSSPRAQRTIPNSLNSWDLDTQQIVDHRSVRLWPSSRLASNFLSLVQFSA